MDSLCKPGCLAVLQLCTLSQIPDQRISFADFGLLVCSAESENVSLGEEHYELASLFQCLSATNFYSKKN